MFHKVVYDSSYVFVGSSGKKGSRVTQVQSLCVHGMKKIVGWNITEGPTLVPFHLQVRKRL